MNDLVKTSIEGRKSGMFNAYEITDQSIIDKIEDLFKRINEFGENCTDSMDFENKFATSELNQEYIELFTEIATTCQPIVRQTEERYVKSDAEYILDDIASEARYQTRNITEPIRRKAHQEAYKTALNTPIIGDIIGAKNTVDFFSRFGKIKKKKKEEDNEEKEDNKE